MRNSALILSLSFLTLGGCAVGPRYAPPSTPAQAGGAFRSSAAGVTAEPTQAVWWRLYGDPVLERLVSRALAENQDLKVAAANLAQAQALVGEARNGLLPSTNLTAGGSYGRSAIANDFAQAEGKSYAKSGAGFSTGFTAAYQVDLFGQVRRTIEAAHANADAARAAEDAMRVTVAAETTSAYVQACGYAAQAAVAQRSVEAARRTFEIVGRQHALGAASDFDLSRASAVYEAARASLPTLQGQHRVALLELAALIGETPAQIPDEASACVTPPKLTSPLPAGDGQALLRRRPDVREAERRLAGDTARIGVAVSELYPNITLNASIADAATTAAGLGVPGSISYGLGPLITWNAPNIGLARAHVAEARAVASGSLASFDSTVLQALKETEQALTAYGGELDRHSALTVAAQQSERALALAQVQYDAGSISLLDLLASQTNAAAADAALAASDQQIAIDQVAVFQALGGGWEQAPPVQPPKIRG